MRKIQILGTGCPKCEELKEKAELAAKELGIEYEIEKISNINEIIEFGVMITPALVVDGEVKAVGKIPSAEELKNIIQ
jgi:small redox-active disulfide protein 2